MKANKIALLILGILGGVYNMNAQPNIETKVYENLDAVIKEALKDNPNIQVSRLQTEQERALKGVSFDLSKTNVSLEYGQTNSIVDNDTRLTINQTFAFPTLYVNQDKLSKAKIKASEIKQNVVKNELIAQVKSSYYELWYLKHKERLLQKQDSIYERFAFAANLRFKAGEYNALEQATAKAELADIQILIQDNLAAIKSSQIQLQNLTNSKSLVDINVGNLETKMMKFPKPQDSTSVSNNPILLFYKEQIEVADKEEAVALSKMLPDITLGYFNQSFNGASVIGSPTVFNSGDRFTGIQLGLRIPIWVKPHLAKIQAAKVQKQENKALFEAVTNNTQTQLQTLFENFHKDKSNLEHYSQNALPQSDLLLKQAQRGFQEGQIGYLEYVQGLNRALTIQTKYLAFVNQYNQTLIKIEQLIIN